MELALRAILFRALKDDAYQTGTLMNLHEVAGAVLRDTLGPEAGPEERKLTCSFCARTKPEVRLVAGHSGAISESCATMAGTIFAEKTNS
jgi:hypothetical protein